MKKALSLILALVLCLPLCACSVETNTNVADVNAIELTLDNYEQYLEVGARAQLKEDYKASNHFVLGVASDGYSKFVTYDFGQNIYGYIWTKGLSQNFNYNDVKIEVEFTGRFCHFDLMTHQDDMEDTATWDQFSFKGICDRLDITGKGNNWEYLDNNKYPLPSGRGVPEFDDWYDGVRMYYKQSAFLEYEYKVVSVSGTVTPA